MNYVKLKFATKKRWAFAGSCCDFLRDFYGLRLFKEAKNQHDLTYGLSPQTDKKLIRVAAESTTFYKSYSVSIS